MLSIRVLASPGKKAREWGEPSTLSDLTIVDHQLGFVALAHSSVSSDIPGHYAHSVAKSVIDRYRGMPQGAGETMEAFAVQPSALPVAIQWPALLSTGDRALTQIYEAIASGMNALNTELTAHFKLRIGMDLTILRERNGALEFGSEEVTAFIGEANRWNFSPLTTPGSFRSNHPASFRTAC